MRPILLPPTLRVERLARAHPRSAFHSGEPNVDDWLKTKALQNQDKHLSATKVLADENTEAIAGYYTLATAEVDFGDLPSELVKKLPKRALPVAVLAWLGVSLARQKQGLGQRLLAMALRDCWDADRAFGIVAVILDCVNGSAKAFYQRADFEEMPGRPYRLYLSAKLLDLIVNGS
jgi:GNAT superfamily N-acetyltransferase